MRRKHFWIGTVAAGHVMLAALPARAADEPHFFLRDGKIVSQEGNHSMERVVDCTRTYAVVQRTDRLFVACGDEGVVAYSLNGAEPPALVERTPSSHPCVSLTSDGQCTEPAPQVRDIAQQIQTDRSPTVASTPVVVPAAKPSNGYVVPQSIAYQGGKIPGGSYIETRPNVAFIATGVSILGTAYAASLITAIAQCGPGMACSAGTGWLYLPIVGPFVTAAMAHTTGGQAIAAFDGGVQTLGGALAITGFIARKKFVVWQDETKMASVAITPSAGGVSLTLTHR